MIYGMVNFSTGPVNLQKDVLEAFSAGPISHRSKEFEKIFHSTSENLCESLNIKQTFILQGSGTLANEVMIWQIKMGRGKGVVFSNGEFGERLIGQCLRNSLDFIPLRKEWGEELDLSDVENVLVNENPEWLLFCHCETSTGVINPLECIVALTKKYNCKCYIDCMSTLGTQFVDLSEVTMATGSSGKGLCAIPGLALVFSNTESIADPSIPVYFDLDFYCKKKGLPFTLSSNLLFALKTALNTSLNKGKWERTAFFSELIYNNLRPLNVIPYAKKTSGVFTMALKDQQAETLGDHLKSQNILLSYQSSYLNKRNWIQLALFGNYEAKQIEYATSKLNKALHAKEVVLE